MDRIESDIAAISRITAVPTILKVISETTGLRLALVARVTEDSWTACATLDRMDFGLRPGDHLDVATTLCREVRASLEPVIIEHASREPQFCQHPTPKLYGFESYIAVPVFRANGEYFGTICALDAEPARLRDGKTVALMTLFAELLSLQLTAEEEHTRDREALSDERNTAELRDQFIAVLGHDLRSPLSSMIVGTSFLQEIVEAPQARKILDRVQDSGQRMSRLIDDVLDFARGRLGGGIPVTPRPVENVEDVLAPLMAEIGGAHPGRALRVTYKNPGAAHFDPARVTQMMTNLVANAIEHSPPGEPVEILVDGTENLLRFAVTNQGEPIPSDLIPRIFRPYCRGERNQASSGLGLGLYIVSEIARSHGGFVQVSSSREAGTTFTVALPRSRP